MMPRPLVILHSAGLCLMPLGKELWWSEQPGGREYVVHAIEAAPDEGWHITLKLMTGSTGAELPAVTEVGRIFKNQAAESKRWMPISPASPGEVSCRSRQLTAASLPFTMGR